MFTLAVHVPFFDQSILLCGFPVVGIVVSAIAAYFVSDALAAVPVEHRKDLTPAQVWLLVIPVFNLVWNFFVFQRVSESFRSYFESTRRPQPGDYGKQMGLISAILIACIVVPCIGILAGTAGLVLAILLIVRFQELKKIIVSGGGGSFPAVPPREPF